jgi:Amiloride-sensitive sodium channel
MNESKTFTVKPKVMSTSDELKHYPVDERKCVFSNERRLKYFNQYTQSNCEIECEVDQVLQECGCVPVFHVEGKKLTVPSRNLVSTGMKSKISSVLDF